MGRSKMTDVELVQHSWAKVMAAFTKEQVGTLFFDMLFQMNPGLSDTVFKGIDMKKQSLFLITFLDAAIEDLDDLAALAPTLVACGERHSGYGARAEHYPIVGAGLIATLKVGLGDAMTPDVTQAWANVYGVMTDAFLQGQATPKGVALTQAYEARKAAVDSGVAVNRAVHSKFKGNLLPAKR
jgi:nitric oxide dioxygenase